MIAEMKSEPSTGYPDETPIRYIQSLSEIGLLGLAIKEASVKLRQYILQEPATDISKGTTNCPFLTSPRCLTVALTPCWWSLCPSRWRCTYYGWSFYPSRWILSFPVKLPSFPVKPSSFPVKLPSFLAKLHPTSAFLADALAATLLRQYLAAPFYAQTAPSASISVLTASRYKLFITLQTRFETYQGSFGEASPTFPPNRCSFALLPLGEVSLPLGRVSSRPVKLHSLPIRFSVNVLPIRIQRWWSFTPLLQPPLMVRWSFAQTPSHTYWLTSSLWCSVNRPLGTSWWGFTDGLWSIAEWSPAATASSASGEASPRLGEASRIC